MFICIWLNVVEIIYFKYFCYSCAIDVYRLEIYIFIQIFVELFGNFWVLSKKESNGCIRRLCFNEFETNENYFFLFYVFKKYLILLRHRMQQYIV